MGELNTEETKNLNLKKLYFYLGLIVDFKGVLIKISCFELHFVSGYLIGDLIKCIFIF